MNVHESLTEMRTPAILFSKDRDSWVNFNKQGGSLFLNVLIQEGKWNSWDS